MRQVYFSKKLRTGFASTGISIGILIIILDLLSPSIRFVLDFISLDGQCDLCNAGIIEASNIFIGLIIISSSAYYFYSLYHSINIQNFFLKNYFNIISAFIAFNIFIILIQSVIGRIGTDEFEHVHSAWYIIQEYLPYTDFFQHHHPLFWYLIAPIILIFGESVKSLIIIRLIMFLMTLGIAYLVYLIAIRITKSKEVGLLSVWLLLTMRMFITTSLEIRPDVPQVFIGLISIYFLICMFQTDNKKYMILSGFVASVSFLFLQKTIFLLVSYSMLFLFKFLKGKLSIQSITYFVISFLFLPILYTGYLIYSGAFKEYVFTNWILNMHGSFSFSAIITLTARFTQYIFFWLLSAVSVVLIFREKPNSDEMKTIAFIGLVLFLSVFLVRTPYRQYFMPAIPLLSITNGYIIKYFCDRFNLNVIYKLVIIISVTILPTIFHLRQAIISDNIHQLEKINFILQNSQDSDYVYDGQLRFNLYRQDLHYFWYSLKNNRGLDTYNSLTDNKYGDYDICDLIMSKRPKFISDYLLNFSECGLDVLYEKTKYSGIYIRK